MNASYSLGKCAVNLKVQKMRGGGKAGRKKRDGGGLERERVREEGKRKGHASDMRQCSLHTGQFIKMIKPSLTLKVEPTIKMTGIQRKERLRD